MSKTKRIEARRARLKARFQKARVEWKRTHPIEAQEKRFALAVEREKRALNRADRDASRLEKAAAKAKLRVIRAERRKAAHAETLAAKKAITADIRKTWQKMTPTPAERKPGFFRRLFRRGKVA